MRRAIELLASLVVLGVPAGAAAATVPTDFTDALVAGGLDQPTGLAFLPDGRLLFVEQISTRVRLLVHGALAATDPVCVVPDVRTSGSNRGLYGIAVDPRWPQHPYVYVHHPTPSGRLSISRYTVGGDLAFAGNGSLTINPATRHELLANLFDAAHNGGGLRFGPDSLLYVSVGDSFATPCCAQDTVHLRGTILRLEVRNLPAGAGGPPAIAAITPAGNPFAQHPNARARLVLATGLRNPFRFHIDPQDGAVMIADVGEDNWEEVNRVELGGENFGWPIREGPDPYGTCPAAGSVVRTNPIHAYDHDDGITIISAGVYRSPAGAPGFPPAYEGDYFFSDYTTGILRRLKRTGSVWALAPAVPGQPSAQNWGTGFDTMTDALEAPDGSLWYCRQFVDFAPQSGEIRRIAYTGVVAVDRDAPRAPTLAIQPMPARGVVRVTFQMPAPARVTLVVHDLSGRRVRVLVPARELGAGSHAASWDGRDEEGRPVAPGAYAIRLAAGEATITRRAVLLR
jgi:glucose/arabinose dehydrogenase